MVVVVGDSQLGPVGFAESFRDIVCGDRSIVQRPYCLFAITRQAVSLAVVHALQTRLNLEILLQVIFGDLV